MNTIAISESRLAGMLKRRPSAAGTVYWLDELGNSVIRTVYVGKRAIYFASGQFTYG